MEALRETTLDELRRRRKAGLSTHPFYWGGFIAAGEWR
jgi:CHAT domain-containing protein